MSTSETINLRVEVDTRAAKAAIDSLEKEAKDLAKVVEDPMRPRVVPPSGGVSAAGGGSSAPRPGSGARRPSPRPSGGAFVDVGGGSFGGVGGGSFGGGPSKEAVGAFGSRLEAGKRAFEFARGGSLDAGVGLARGAFAVGGAAGAAAFSAAAVGIGGLIRTVSKASSAFEDFAKDINLNADMWSALGEVMQDFGRAIMEVIDGALAEIVNFVDRHFLGGKIADKQIEQQARREAERQKEKDDEADKFARKQQLEFDDLVSQALELKNREIGDQEIARAALQLAPQINNTSTAATYGSQAAVDIANGGGPMMAMVEQQRLTNDLLRKLNTPKKVLELMS